MDSQLKYRPLSKNPHSRAEFSLLSSESPPVKDMRGMLNLFVMLLVALNIRLVIENISKYGWLIPNPITILVTNHDSVPLYLFYLFLVTFPGVTFAVERFIAPRMQSRRLPLVLHSLTIFLVLYLPYVAVRATSELRASAVVLLMASCVYAMKIVSYVQICADIQFGVTNKCLAKMVANPEDLALAEKYPKCLTCFQWYEFVSFPTLTFQLSYPRTDSISFRRLFRYLAEFLFCSTLMAILVEQYMRPLLNNAHAQMSSHFIQKSWMPLITLSLERWLKLIVPALYLWLLGFFALFHCFLNFLAEATFFADRRFYDDWWNAGGFREYWQKWNLPVHHWIVRHVYVPCRSFGLSQTFTALLVFFLSGVVHEYIIVVPLHLPVNGVVSSGFILQLPLILLTDLEFVQRRKMLGNCLFWFSHCFTGQPAAILMFFLLDKQHID